MSRSRWRNISARGEDGLDIALPVVPAMAEVAGKHIISSSRVLCRDLIDVLRKGERALIENRDLVFDLQVGELSKFLAINRSGYESALMKEGRTAIEAKRDIDHIVKLLGGIKSIRGSTTAGDGAFSLTIQGDLQ